MMRKEPYGVVLIAESSKHMYDARACEVVPLEWFGELAHKALGPDNAHMPRVSLYFADVSPSTKPTDVYPRDWEWMSTYEDLTNRCIDPVWKNRLIRNALIDTPASDYTQHKIKWAWSYTQKTKLVVICRSVIPISPSGLQTGMSYAVTLADLCREQFNKVQVRPILEKISVLAGY